MTSKNLMVNLIHRDSYVGFALKHTRRGILVCRYFKRKKIDVL